MRDMILPICFLSKKSHLQFLYLLVQIQPYPKDDPVAHKRDIVIEEPVQPGKQEAHDHIDAEHDPEPSDLLRSGPGRLRTIRVPAMRQDPLRVSPDILTLCPVRGPYPCRVGGARAGVLEAPGSDLKYVVHRCLGDVTQNVEIGSRYTRQHHHECDPDPERTDIVSRKSFEIRIHVNFISVR